jgi:CheY-like chemotaxis protein
MPRPRTSRRDALRVISARSWPDATRIFTGSQCPGPLVPPRATRLAPMRARPSACANQLDLRRRDWQRPLGRRQSPPGGRTTIEVGTRHAIAGGMRSKRQPHSPEPEARRSEERGTPHDAAGTIVIVDDDEGVGNSVAETLTAEGYRTRYCSRPEAALFEISNGAKASLVVLDLWIPPMGSATFLSRLRGLSPSTPVLLLSGSVRDLQRAQREADAVLLKPVEWTTLVRTVDKLLRSYPSGALSRRPKIGAPARCRSRAPC